MIDISNANKITLTKNHDNTYKIEIEDDNIKCVINRAEHNLEIVALSDIKENVNCKTCKNNPLYNNGYAPPHTCDVCTSLDSEEYEMWERKEN